MDSLFCYFIKMPSKVLALLKKKNLEGDVGV